MRHRSTNQSEINNSTNIRTSEMIRRPENKNAAAAVNTNYDRINYSSRAAALISE